MTTYWWFATSNY